MNKALLALATGGFGIGLTEFVIMGILPEVANDLHITIPQASHFISAYAIGVVVGAPLLTSIGGKMPAQKVLLLLMVLFTVFNTFFCISRQLWNTSGFPIFSWTSPWCFLRYRGSGGQ